MPPNLVTRRLAGAVLQGGAQKVKNAENPEKDDGPRWKLEGMDNRPRDDAYLASSDSTAPDCGMTRVSWKRITPERFLDNHTKRC